MTTFGRDANTNYNVNRWDMKKTYTVLAHTWRGSTSDQLNYCDDEHWEFYQKYVTGVTAGVYFLGDFFWSLFPVFYGIIPQNGPADCKDTEGKPEGPPFKNFKSSVYTFIGTGITVNVADLAALGVAEMDKLRSENCGKYDKSVGLALCNSQPPNANSCWLFGTNASFIRENTVSYESYAQFAKNLYSLLNSIKNDVGCARLKAGFSGLSMIINDESCVSLQNQINSNTYIYSDNSLTIDQSEFTYDNYPIVKGFRDVNLPPRDSLLGIVLCSVSDNYCA